MRSCVLKVRKTHDDVPISCEREGCVLVWPETGAKMQPLAITGTAHTRTPQIPSGHITLLLVGELDYPVIRMNRGVVSTAFGMR
jgi:hypothetical protein